MTTLAILTNIPSPYRVDLFAYLQTHVQDFTIHIIFSSASESNRDWDVQTESLTNVHFLRSRTMEIQNTQDTRYTHIPANVRRTLSAIRPDVIVASEYNPASLLSFAWAKLHRVPFVSWTDGTLHSERNISLQQRLARRLIVGGAAAYIASSGESRAAQLAYGADPTRVFISLLTVDIAKYWQERREDDGKTLLYVGGLIPRKGVRWLLSDILPRIRAPFTLRIVGDGPEREALVALAEANGLAGRVRFEGFRQSDALRTEYAQSSIFVFPTREDCYGLTSLEAMCAGLPVISSPWAGSAAELVDEGVTGYVVGDDPAAWAKAIDGLLEDVEKAQMMGAAGREKAREFAFERVAPPFLEAIQLALEREA